MASYEDRSERIIRKYNDVKETRVKLETQRDMLMEKIEKKYGVTTIDELKDLMEKKEAEFKELKEKIEPMLESLEDSLAY